MIVESNPLVAEDIEERLKTLGYTVCAVVSSRAKAVAKAVEMRPHIALINPELEGQTEGVEAAKEIYERCDIPVIYLTDYVNEDLLKKVKSTRAFGHVYKPYETNQLYLSIENHLHWFKEDQEFRNSEQRCSTILNSIGDAVISTDEGGFITFMNPVAEILTGWPLEAACGRYITHVFNVSIGKSNTSLRTSLMNVLHRGITLHWGLSAARDDAYLDAKSGLKIAIDYSAAPLKDTKRNIVGMAVTFRDMRKHKEIENRLEQTITELQNQNQLMETVFNSISDGIIVINPMGRTLLANPSAERIFGMPPQEVPPEEWPETYGIFYPDQETYIPADQMPVTQALQGKIFEEGEFFIRNKEQPAGIYAMGKAVPLFDSNQEVIGSVAIIRDITQDKIAAAQLEQTIDEMEKQAQLVDTVFENMSDGVVVADDKGQYIMANPAAEKMIGQNFEDINLSRASEQYGLSHPTTDALFPADQLPLALAIKGQATNNVEMRVNSEQRSQTVYVSVNGRPLLDKEGTLRGGVVVARDVTEIKETEIQLEQTITELQNQNQLMETVFNSISDGVVVADENGKYVLFNPSAQAIVGMGATETPPDKWAEAYGVFYPDKVTLFPSDQLPLVQAIGGKKIDTTDLFIRNQHRPDGVLISINGSPLQDKKGNIKGGVSTFRDVTQLKEIEIQLEQTITELQNQNQLMETVFNSISDGVTVTDEKGNFLLVNPEAEQILGMGAMEVTPDQWAETYGIFQLDKTTPFSAELPLMRVISGEAIDDINVFVRNAERPEGVYVNVSGRPLQSSTGDVRGCVIAFRNVTQLKETEHRLEQTVKELQNQNQLMETVFNSISDGVILANKEGQYVMANRTAEQMTGRRLQPVGVRDAVERYGFFLPDEKTPFPADQLPIARALRGEPADNIGMFVYDPSVMRAGIHLSVSARPLQDGQGAITGSVSVSRDITELRQAETNLKHMIAQLEEQGNLLESIFNSISDGVVVADASGNFTIFNPSAERIIGIGATETDTDEWSDTYGLFFPDRVTPFPADELPLVRAIRGEIADEVEMFVRNPNVPDGVFISVNGRPLQDDEGNPKGGVIVFRDVTQRMIAEEALTQAFAQGRLEIVDTILHNIGNAINSVTSGAEMLHRELKDNPLIRRLAALASAIKAREDDWIDYIKNDPQGQQVLPFICAIADDFNNQNNRWLGRTERIKLRATHIADIVITQKSFGNSSIVRKDVSIYKVIDDALKLQQEIIDKRGIQIDIDCENAPQEIRVQESQFHQMLVNLIKNSIEAIDERIQSGGFNETPHIHIRTYIDGDFYCLEVIDNGIGIKPENSKMIFAAGYTTKRSGSGLGLHSSANFVIASGGQIQPLSEGIGKGMTMRVMLRLSSILP